MASSTKLPLKDIYKRDRDLIRSTILEDNPPSKLEIDIQAEYDRSTQTLGNYVTLDWQPYTP
jgi:hypothetical protein